MPTFLLDGKEIEFKPGETILQAAHRHPEVEIPHYCFHAGLQITAQCRMCLVDIVDQGNGRGMPKLQTSCSSPAAQGMKVDSQSQKVKDGQNLINEFLLVNHPLDCPICDQAGECDLQNYAFRYGSGHSEMSYEKRTYGLRDVGTFIVLERNRCVHCSRCERFSRDVEGQHDFGMFLRSHELTFDTYEDARITHKFQGNLADICPVGAILNRDWRFKKRAWKLHKTPSVCPGCSTGCNVTVEQHENKVFRLKPRENPEVNRWWMCDEGRVGFHAVNDRKTRIAEPHARIQGKLQPADWEAAYVALVQRMQALGAAGGKGGDQIVGLADTQATNEELFLFKLLLQNALGAAAYYPQREGRQQEQPPKTLKDPFLYTLITTDKSPNTRGAQALGLAGDAGDARAKAALAKGPAVLLVLGTPWAGAALPAWVQDAARRSKLVVWIGTHEGAWSQAADVVLPGLTYVEKTGSFTNKAGRVQRIAPALRPPDAAREQTRILLDLLSHLGKPQELGTPEQIFNALGAQAGAFKGLTWQALGAQGAVLAG